MSLLDKEAEEPSRDLQSAFLRRGPVGRKNLGIILLSNRQIRDSFLKFSCTSESKRMVIIIGALSCALVYKDSELFIVRNPCFKDVSEHVFIK